MESAGILLLVSMCLVGALIAYAADLLGRHLGKKRLSLFGMRPKHTAALLATVAGALIPLVTIAVLWSSVREVRVMLSEGNRAAQERDQRVAELREATERLDQTRANVARLEARSIELNDTVRDLGAKNQILQKENKQTTAALSASKKAAEVLQRSSNALKRESAGLKSTVNKSRKEVAQLRDTRQELEARIAEVQARQREVTAYQIQQDLELQRLERQRKELDRQLADLQQSNAALVNSGEQFAQRIADLQRERADLDTQIQTVRGEREKLTAEIQSLESLRTELMESLGAVRLQPIVYSRGDEVGRIVVRAGATQNEVEQALNGLFRSARVRAESAGARSVGAFASVSLIPVTNSEGRLVSVEEQERLLIREAAFQRDPQVLLANALVNSFAGEYVRVQVQALPNTIVFREGEVIADTRIDGSLGEQQVLVALTNFVVERVAANAVNRKMIPAVGQPSPLGEINDGEIVRLVAEIAELNRVVRVQAVAAVDTRRADRLRIVFKLR